MDPQETAPVVREDSDTNLDKTYTGPKEDKPHEAAGTNKDDVCSFEPPTLQKVEARFVLEALDAVPPEANILDHDVSLLHKANHSDPFSVIGWHFYNSRSGAPGSYLVIRTWLKDARDMKLRCVDGTSCVLSKGNEAVWMHKRCEWLFQMAFRLTSKATGQAPTAEELKGFTGPLYELIVRYEGDKTDKEWTLRDAFNFGVLLPQFDLQHFQTGSCWHVDNLMGSHIMTYAGCKGVRFAVWAPNAVFVSVVGDWNAWDGRAHPMRKRHEYGVWELFVPHIGAGQKYGYRIHSKAGQDFVKIDPYAQEFEVPPAHASIISACDDAYKASGERFQWTDSEWMRKREELGRSGQMRRQPMSIYEVHLPSWMRGDDNRHLSYREIADRLVSHVKNLNFTHVEFLPLAQHPFEGSWGYQVTGQYAPYSRLGSADDLKYLINKLHEENIGVFVDFVPAHFCKDAWGLVHFDGEPCYEYADPREGEHKGWGTMVFNFRRNEVRSFLLGAAYHWLRRYHVDGLRIDAVSSMLYKNYCRKPGEWIPNEKGGDANFQAISLLQELNWVVHREWPGVFTMAEESTSWAGVTDQEKGLGFDAKWDLGWMNDTLAYLCTPTPNRPSKHSKLTFRGLYMGNERWVLPLSHDEVVSGKGSLLDKCGFQGAPFEERIRTLRTLYGFQIGQPGRPLIFMGGEIAQGREWSDARSVDWHEGEEDLRRKFCVWMSDLLAVYKYHPALHAGDDEPHFNFQWTDCDNAGDCLVAFIRKYAVWHNDILVVCNFSGSAYRGYPFGVPHGGEWEVLLNSDDWRYGGTMFGPGNLTKVHTTQGGRPGWPYCLWLDVPPFSCMYLRCPQPKETPKAGAPDAVTKKVDELAAAALADPEAVPTKAAAEKLQEKVPAAPAVVKETAVAGGAKK